MLRTPFKPYKTAKKIMRPIFLLLLVLCIFAAPFAAGRASAASPAPSHIDAVLLIDVSNSMKKSDKNNIAGEAMKMFIDMLSAQGDKVGIVAYTDKVQREKALLQIGSAADKQDLKDFIDGLDRGAYTDIAVGMEEAVKVLENGSDPGHEPMIVMLADGNNDLNEATGRTQSQSDQELDAAVETAKQKGYPVYTIGLNANGKLNKEILAGLSNKTSGKAFTTDSADDLPQILSEIFADHLKLKVVPVQSITANGSYQEVTVNVPNGSVLEANISIMSAQPVTAKLTDPSGKEAAIPSNDVLLSKSSTYSLIKLLSPEQGDWKLQVKGVPKDKIDINLVFNYDLELKLDALQSKTYKKGDTVEISSHLFSNGAQVTLSSLYQDMKAVLLATDTDTGKVQELPMDNSGAVFKGSFEIPESHNYELKVRAEESSFYRESDVLTINAKTGAVATSTSPPAGAGGSEPAQDKSSSKTLYYIIGGIVLVLAAAVVLWLLRQKSNRGFVGQMVVEVVDGNTGEKTYPQYKKLAAFRGKFTLHQLLQLAPELKESEKLVFTPGKNDRLMLRGSEEISVERSGRVVDTARGLELKSGDRISVALQTVDKTILLEYLI
ncbi:vWA domain-containing protein [Paenibacillus jilunlii]|uniref:von Willebrand factor type A domain-containing protein n=1 Tax=Paenibacillus jilunlii TaxID=682956 RepID=A0A1G9T6Y2_9BACL|nr:vWA domain-containing protein [Paenibacillus jilunlii]SDM42845.1 von Willebrand factor type A domain-containing protein [Paenibacillus jilunlii]